MSPIYANDLMQELEERLASLSKALDMLIKSGKYLTRYPTIFDSLFAMLDATIALPEFEDDVRGREKRTLAESLSLLGVATFFSSISASTLAISVQQTSKVFDVVNFFWFASLVLSITSVMNSLLAFTWKQSILYVSFLQVTSIILLTCTNI